MDDWTVPVVGLRAQINPIFGWAEKPNFVIKSAHLLDTRQIIFTENVFL